MRGGKRPGAGRKPGVALKRTREIADKAAAQGITPLEVMLEAMRDAWTEGAKEGIPAEQRIAYRMAAVETAHKAAPYMHPRLQQIESKTELEVTRSTVSPDPMPADEWERTYGRSAH